MKSSFKPVARAWKRCDPVVADLRKLAGKQIYLRVVDHASAGWGHINFDHFRFHDEPPPIVERAADGRNGAMFIRTPACRPKKRHG